ncbi:glycosyltransferase family 4 protein [Olivibacter sp. SDN3]|uniref:glycosyltransferase family 4 protein n=1 Tax=Olivibacter sp. SDN3 TaxID=2764720 RepID=UPI0016511269|nr:glycosyltransferase family 1 protein [Olivibacter sp. SDN3]QNL47725.1 glycosyltransferase family 4 protein [Olivibacter sp. SDN3]
MKIGYDAKRAFHNKTGLGNYSRSLIENIWRCFPENHYYLFNPKPSAWYHPEGLHLTEIQPIGFYKKLSSYWRSFVLNALASNKYQLDIFHGLSHELPLGKKVGTTKWVLTVHDLIFIRYPQYFNRIDRKIYLYKVKKACKKADKIVAISEQTKLDIVNFLDIPAHKIVVIYQDCHPDFKKEVSQAKKTATAYKFQLPSSYLLQVGTIENRKNLLLTVNALKKTTSTLKLVVVGKPTPYLAEVKAEISKHQLQERVIFLHNVPFEDLPAIYQMAAIFIYPSRFEGFGIPIIEALHSKVPVIAATGSCLEESGGPNSIYVNPDNSAELANAIQNVLADPESRQKQIDSGVLFAEKFNPDRLASQLMNLYKSVLL